MIFPPETDRALAHTINCLVQIQKELLKLLRDCSVSERVLPHHSLFSSKRVFRTDEMHLGLHYNGNSKTFSLN